jgi:chitosanase
MQVTPRQKAVIENIVTLHETGRLNAKSYGMVVNVRGDPGGLTYGKHQVTINSGGLYLMLNRYCTNPNANRQLVEAISRFLPAIRAKNAAVVASPVLRDALSQAGNDPVMAQVQDGYFDDQYWNPAVRFCVAKGFYSGLAMAVVYDSTIHGSLFKIDKRLQPGLLEATWIRSYVETRRQWMATHPTIPLLRRCTYRMDTFRALLDANNYDLNSPVWAHGRRADLDFDNSGAPVQQQTTMQQPVPVPALATTQRILDRGDKGADVAEMQSMLIRIGYHDVTADGAFGPKTEAAVVAFQRMYGLVADGIVGPSTWRVLDQVDD